MMWKGYLRPTGYRTKRTSVMMGKEKYKQQEEEDRFLNINFNNIIICRWGNGPVG